LKRLIKRIKNFISPEKQLSLQLEQLLGFKPKRLQFYQQALMHRSKPEDIAESNERLEFLGDAILGAIIAEYLFKKYPTQYEGFLTEFRSRIVRRETMNNLAMRMGLNKLLQYNQNDRSLSRSHIFGNALEALIGAVYLDQGFSNTRNFILQHLLKAYLDLETIETTDTNYKNKLLSWAQRKNYTVVFETLEEKHEGARKLFTVGIVLSGTVFAKGTGFTKKDAGQVAAQKALEMVESGNYELPAIAKEESKEKQLLEQAYIPPDPTVNETPATSETETTPAEEIMAANSENADSNFTAIEDHSQHEGNEEVMHEAAAEITPETAPEALADTDETSN
jgi:ribonuclease III